MQNDQLAGQPSQAPVPADEDADQHIEEPLLPSINKLPTEPSNTHDTSDTNSTIAAELSQAVQLFNQLLAEMQSLREDFDTKVKYDESKERLIDSLHRELQVYREGLHFKILQPVFTDLIAMHDDLGKLIENLMSDESNTLRDRTIKNLTSFQDTIEEILSRNGVETFCGEGTIFLPSKQRTIQVIDTSDPTLDKQIARRVRKGFEYEGKVLRPELVATYRAIPGGQSIF